MNVSIYILIQGPPRTTVIATLPPSLAGLGGLWTTPRRSQQYLGSRSMRRANPQHSLRQAAVRPWREPNEGLAPYAKLPPSVKQGSLAGSPANMFENVNVMLKGREKVDTCMYLYTFIDPVHVVPSHEMSHEDHR
jgi:hypothetical protein